MQVGSEGLHSGKRRSLSVMLATWLAPPQSASGGWCCANGISTLMLILVVNMNSLIIIIVIIIIIIIIIIITIIRKSCEWLGFELLRKPHQSESLDSWAIDVHIIIIIVIINGCNY